MHILSWNILASEWIKQKYYPTVNSTILFDRKTRFERIKKRIMISDADVIMLQEVMKKEYTHLKKLLKNYSFSSLSRVNWGGKSESGNVTILKNSSFKNIKHTYHSFFVQTSCIYKEKQLHFFNIHLSDTSYQKRKDQLKQIKDLCINQPYCVIAGDFNNEYTSQAKLFKIPGFTVRNKCPTYYIEKKMNIDNILTKGFRKKKIMSCPHYPNELDYGFLIYGSDHLPIETKVVLR